MIGWWTSPPWSGAIRGRFRTTRRAPSPRSRSARRSAEFFPLQAELRRLGIALVTPQDEPRQEFSAARTFYQGVMALAAELEAGLISERVRDTLRLRVSQGMYRGGNLPLGLRWVKETSTWERDDDAADTATAVFETFLQTRQLEATAQALNAGGYRTANGRKWSGSSVRALLHGPGYRGLLRYGGQDYPCPTLPEIVPAALVRRVDAIFANRQGRTQRCDSSDVATFTGLLRCPACGNWLSAHMVRKPNERVHVSYYCWRARQQPVDCTWGKYMGQVRFEQAIVRLIAERLRATIAELPEGTHKRGDSPQRRLRRLQQMDAERERLLSQHQRGWIDDLEMARRLDDLQQRRETLQREIASLPAEVTVTRAELQGLLENVEKHWWDWPVPHRRDVLQTLVEYIEPNRDDFTASRIAWRETHPVARA